MRQRAISLILFSFIVGVFLSSFLNFGGAFALLFVFLGITFFLFYKKERSGIFLFLCLFFVSFGLGFLRYQTLPLPDNYNFFEQNVGQKINIVGIVSDEPEIKENYVRFVLKDGDTKILIYAEHYPEFNYGDELGIKGVLKKPSNFISEGDSEGIGKMNWPQYLAKDDIYFEMFFPEIEFLSSGNGNYFKRILFGIKNKFTRALSFVIPQPHAAFMGGLTVGDRESIPNDLKLDFNATGMTHIVALSGYNVTIIADSIIRIFSFLPRYFGMSTGAFGIIAFAIMTGASATTVRASVMALMAVLARATGRIYAITWALFLAGFFMILLDPKILRFDVSFQLSFLATLGLIFISPLAEKKLQFMPKKFKIREMAAATVSAQIAVFPLLVYKTGALSLVSLPVNLLVLPFIPVTMFFGFLSGAIGMLSVFLSVPLGWISFCFLHYELFVIKSFAKIPYGSIAVPNFSAALAIISYLIIIFGVIWFIIKKRKKDAEEKL